MAYEIHPFAEIFPLHDGQPLWDLRDDIRANKQQHKAMLYQGKLLDGRRRSRACDMLGIELKTSEFKGNDQEALAYVVSANLKRRHLGEGERMMIAARLATMKLGENQHTKRVAQIALPSTETAAGMLNVSADGVKRAKKVVVNGTPVLQAAVADGTLSVSDAANVATEPPKVQDEAVKEVKKKKARTATGAVKKRKSIVPEPGIDSDADEEVIKDSEGAIVPDRCRAAFKLTPVFGELCRRLDVIVADVKELAKGPAKRMLIADSIIQSIQSARKALWGSRPTHLCPYCKGEGCDGCKKEGWTIKTYSRNGKAEKQ